MSFKENNIFNILTLKLEASPNCLKLHRAIKFLKNCEPIVKPFMRVFFTEEKNLNLKSWDIVVPLLNYDW